MYESLWAFNKCLKGFFYSTLSIGYLLFYKNICCWRKFLARDLSKSHNQS